MHSAADKKYQKLAHIFNKPVKNGRTESKGVISKVNLLDVSLQDLRLRDDLDDF